MTIIDVDDGDARIMYSYGWSRGGSPPDYNHTISYTTTQGAQFTFVFLGMSDSGSCPTGIDLFPQEPPSGSSARWLQPLSRTPRIA